MAKQGRFLSNRKRKSSATFHVNEDFGAAWRERNRARSMGPARTVGTALSLSLALGMGFVAMHYLPAQLSPANVLRVSDIDSEALRKRPDGVMAWAAPIWQSLQTRRSYMWSGDTVDVRYTLPEGRSVQLVVQQCARRWVLEVFSCSVVSQQVMEASGSSGYRKLVIQNEGFYRFREVGAADSRVIWRRG